MKIINFERFKEECAKFNKPALKELLFHFAIQRMLQELVLVNAICTHGENDEVVPKSETLADLGNTIEGERILINLLGRMEAAKVYGVMEGISSDGKTVDYVLANDFVQYYKASLQIDEKSTTGG